jgi:hypothetical protein
MPRAQWKLVRDRPAVPVILTLQPGNQRVKRDLLADTGAGAGHVNFEILLTENDCLSTGGIPSQYLRLRGAYVGSFRIYLVRVEIPTLAFSHALRAVGVPTVPPGFGGIACFRFLNRFTYGNFGDAARFGLEI